MKFIKLNQNNIPFEKFIFTIILVISVCCLSDFIEAQEQQQQQQPQQQQQQQPPQNQQRTTITVTPNANGQGVRVVDQNTGRELINTNQLATNGQQIEIEGDDGLDDRVVSGLLEWLEKKKKKKKEKEEEKKPQILPIILPEPHQNKQPKIIHIHINNHIEKHHKKQHNHKHQKQEKKHHGGKHGGGGGGHDYEDHDHHGGGGGGGGHYEHAYHGKHSWPLLSHHYNWDQDFHYGMSGYGGGHGGGHSSGHGGGHDDYSGYESKQVASKVALINTVTKNNNTNNGIQLKKSNKK